MNCPKCKGIGWIGTGRFAHEDDRYCTCQAGVELASRVNKGTTSEVPKSLPPEAGTVMRWHQEDEDDGA